MKRIACASLVLACACSKTPEPSPVEKPAASAAQSASASPQAAASPASSAAPAATSPAAGPGDVAWDAPSTWTSMPNPNSMRKATYKIAKASGDADDAELSVSSAAGGVGPNIDRWAHQFGEAKPTTEKRKVNGLDVTMVEMKGKWNGGGPGMNAPPTPKDDWMLLGAIVDAGDKQHFFKLVGPAKTVTSAKKDFEKLVASLRAK